MKHKKNAFLICPVRGHDMSETEETVKELEKKYHVHWPPRDTNQEDPVGLQICLDNMDAIKKSDIVLVIWDGKSQGCLFDLGIAFAMEKPIEVIEAPPVEKGKKSFQAMMSLWELGEWWRKPIETKERPCKR